MCPHGSNYQETECCQKVVLMLAPVMLGLSHFTLHFNEITKVSYWEKSSQIKKSHNVFYMHCNLAPNLINKLMQKFHNNPVIRLYVNAQHVIEQLRPWPWISLSRVHLRWLGLLPCVPLYVSSHASNLHHIDKLSLIWSENLQMSSMHVHNPVHTKALNMQTVAGLLPLNTQRHKHCLIIFILPSFKADNKLRKVSDHKHKLHVCTFLWERLFCK